MGEEVCERETWTTGERLILPSIVQYCTVPNCSVLYCTVLYCMYCKCVLYPVAILHNFPHSHSHLTLFLSNHTHIHTHTTTGVLSHVPPGASRRHLREPPCAGHPRSRANLVQRDRTPTQTAPRKAQVAPHPRAERTRGGYFPCHCGG
jgi:hypothetical protein